MKMGRPRSVRSFAKKKEEGGIFAHLERVAALRFTIDHLHNVLVELLARRVSLRPVISRTAAVLRHENILRIIQVRKRRRQYIVDDLAAHIKKKV